tara:strand:- start:539 stop:751 length:213 start_codon:yes stop_codon:yes gene_type:complete
MPKTRKDYERIQREWESKSRRKLSLETKLRYWLANNQSDVYVYIFTVILFVLFYLAIWFFDLDTDKMPNF